MKPRPIALLVTPVLPLPGGSGRALRAWDWLQQLARGHRVHLLVTGAREDWPELPSDYPAETLWPLADSVSITRRLQRLCGLLLPLLALVSTRFVSDWQRWNSSTSLDALEARLAGEAVQRIVVFRLYLQGLGQTLAARFPTAEYDLDLDDLESHTRLSVAQACWRMGYRRDAARGLSTALQYRLIERGLAPGYRHIYLAAGEDAHALPARLRDALACRPNRIALPGTPAPLPEGELGLLFVGTLNYPPNEEAVRFLLNELVPLLNRQLTSPWRLRIVGRHASTELQALSRSMPQVELCTEVDDLGDSYARSNIALVPLFAGGGTKLKTLEGFAHRRAVIATDQGVRGLEAVPGEHYLPARDAGAFAASIVRLAAHPDLAERIAEAGWTLCRQRYARA
ncbi:glycosyltransferase [Pseudomonas sp.]|uniref:glycosyltransferase n=1 Tax=Pseudomonas sp. TaxID=306 RepID=UPI0028AD0A16|nr:glycosyltransferase [Pseudomonas sp.]